MLVLDRKNPRPAAVPVPLGSGAVINIRPATSADYFLISTRANQLAAGLKDGDEVKMQVAQLLGEEISRGDVADPAWISSIIDRLILVLLTSICAESWSGVGEKDATGAVVDAALDEATITCLLRDATIAGRIQKVVMGSVHAESAEGKGSAVSQNGAAAAAETIAPAAAPPAPAAPKASAE